MPKKKQNKTFPFFKKVSKQVKDDLRILSVHTKLLLGLGVLFIIIPLFFYLNEGVQLAFFTPKVIATPKQYAAPTWISIPSVSMELPVFEEAIARNAWGISTEGISHLDISARPGESGPIILYGHNTNDRFGPIRWMSVGQKVELSTTDGKHHFYTVTKIQDVSPNQVSILTSQKGETLILYTCDGFADLQRFVVIAKPKSSE